MTPGNIAWRRGEQIINIEHAEEDTKELLFKILTHLDQFKIPGTLELELRNQVYYIITTTAFITDHATEENTIKIPTKGPRA